MRYTNPILAGVAVVLVGLATTAEGAFAVLFGWVPFLGRVLPRVTADGPSVMVGLAAVAIFALIVHRLGRAWRRSTGGVPWKWRWTAGVVLVPLVLFAAGIAVVGVVHQVGWLATSKQPLRSERLAYDTHPANTIKQMGIYLHAAHDTQPHFPPGGSFTDKGEMLHSWETYTVVYGGWGYGIDLTRPWLDPVNEPKFKDVFPGFINPGFRTPELEDRDGFGLSHYSANVRVLGPNTRTTTAAITDGTANTILVGEVNAGFKPWGHPINWRDPAVGITHTAAGFGGPPGAGGAHFLMADGSVRFLSDRTDPSVLRSLATPAAGD